MSKKLLRTDYVQVGLTSKQTLRLVKKRSNDEFEVVIGDRSGSVHLFILRPSLEQIETLFKTLPGPNSKINCVQVLETSKSTKLLVACGPATIKGFNKRGKQFFLLELTNLTEPITLFRFRAPDEIFITGQYIFNSYSIDAENLNAADKSGPFDLSGKSSALKGTIFKSRNYYVCAERINDFVLLENRFGRNSVPVLACQDRLLRVLRDSNCIFEVEICGIPSVLQIVPRYDGLPQEIIEGTENDLALIYGTLDGKIALVTFRFVDHGQLEPLHSWELPTSEQSGVAQPVTCLVISNKKPEFYVGRSDGSIEIWRFTETLDEECVSFLNLSNLPVLFQSYNAGESITNIMPIENDDESLLLICCTFTGIVFGLTRNSNILQAIQKDSSAVNNKSKENTLKIEALKAEIEKLEKKLETERKTYIKQTQGQGVIDMISESNFSVLPFFAIQDSFVLHGDASYILLLESEVAIDVVILHCDIGLDLIDCERNSAVISFNETNQDNDSETVATFRCQAATNKLEIRLRPIEGKAGKVGVYTVSRITPKSCIFKSYDLKPLALHKRQYSNTISEDGANVLTIQGRFTLSDVHGWLRDCIPEVPEKVPLSAEQAEAEILCYVSTMTGSILVCHCSPGLIRLVSDSVSTISILKDFVTRSATKASVPIEIAIEISNTSLEAILNRLWPMIVNACRENRRQELSESLFDLESSDAEGTAALLKDLNLSLNDKKDNKNCDKLSQTSIDLDRIYGIITDLFIDYHKLKGSIMGPIMKKARERLADMINDIETSVFTNSNNSRSNFLIKLFQFWNIHRDSD